MIVRDVEVIVDIAGATGGVGGTDTTGDGGVENLAAGTAACVAEMVQLHDTVHPDEYSYASPA